MNVGCFYSLTYLSLTNYISAIMLSKVSECFSQSEIASLSLVTAMLKYSSDIIESLFLKSPTMDVLSREIAQSLEKCDLRDLKQTASHAKVMKFLKFENGVLNRYLGEGTIETKWIASMIHSVLLLFMKPEHGAWSISEMK